MSDLSIEAGRLGLITGGQLQAALDRFGSGRLTNAAAVPFGLFGQNVFVESDRGSFVPGLATADPGVYGRLTRSAGLRLDGQARLRLYHLDERVIVWAFFHRPGHIQQWRGRRAATFLDWYGPYRLALETRLGPTSYPRTDANVPHE